MTDDPNRDDLHWLLEPPPSGGINVHIDIAPDALITDELRAALDGLVAALAAYDAGNDVEGFSGSCMPHTGCPTRGCNLGGCPGQDCVGRTTCQIQPPSCAGPAYAPPRVFRIR